MKNIYLVQASSMYSPEIPLPYSVAMLEAYALQNKKIRDNPYDFTVANAMISNFHMPLSTLLMIVAAFGGYEQVMDAYHVALKEGYRFGTYGDAMLILDK